MLRVSSRSCNFVRSDGKGEGDLRDRVGVMPARSLRRRTTGIPCVRPTSSSQISLIIDVPQQKLKETRALNSRRYYGGAVASRCCLFSGAMPEIRFCSFSLSKFPPFIVEKDKSLYRGRSLESINVSNTLRRSWTRFNTSILFPVITHKWRLLAPLPPETDTRVSAVRLGLWVFLNNSRLSCSTSFVI